MMRQSTRIFPVVLAALSCFSMALAQENTEPASQAKPPGQAAQLTLDDLRTFTDVFNQARKNYVEEVDDKTLLDAAIRGMLQELDPHSSYLPAQELEQLNDAALGRYSGIGIEVLTREGEIVVNAIINGSPADEAGLNPGDVITSINGHPVKGRPAAEAMDELQGEPDSEIVLQIVPPDGAQREVKITREYIKVPTLSFRLLDDSIAYFKMTQFHQESASNLEKALASVQGGGTELSVLVIDLRGNPGGVLRQAVATADGFLDEGVIVSTRGRNSAMQLEFEASPGQWIPGIPVMVLVDHNTASASEVLAGALQDLGRAVIVGERTFGKGSVQSVLPLKNGAGIKLTTARYYTPSGRSIQAEGIEPDVVIEWNAEPAGEDGMMRESDLDRHLGHESNTEANGPAPSRLVPAEFPLEQVLQALRDAEIIPD